MSRITHRLVLTVDRLEVQVSESFPVSELCTCLRLLLPQQSLGSETLNFVAVRNQRCIISDALQFYISIEGSDVEDAFKSSSVDLQLLRAGVERAAIGSATIPLAVLLGEAWVEGSAPLMGTHLSAGALAPGSLATSEATQIGILSLRLALERAPVPATAGHVTSNPGGHLSAPALPLSETANVLHTTRQAPPPPPSTTQAPADSRAPAPPLAASQQTPLQYAASPLAPPVSKSPSPVLPASWAPMANTAEDISQHHQAPAPLAEHTHTRCPPFPVAQGQAHTCGGPGSVRGVHPHAQCAYTPSPVGTMPPVVQPVAAAAWHVLPPTHGLASSQPQAHSQCGDGGLRDAGGVPGEHVPGQASGAGSTEGQHSQSLDVWAGVRSSSAAHVTPESARERAAREAALWRGDQEAAAEAELAAASVQRQSILETEWRGQHARRAVAHEDALAKLADAEGALGKELAELEAHEAQLAVAEAQAVKAAEGLERAAARRRGDTEAAVRRLQAELAHALDIERSRNADAEAARDTAAAAAVASRSAAAASRRALRELHQARQQSESALAEREVAAARTEQEEAEGRLKVALEGKAGMRQAAQELAADLQAARQEAQAVADDGVAMVCGRVRDAQVQVAAAEQRQQLEAQEAALRGMLSQLQALKTAEVT